MVLLTFCCKAKGVVTLILIHLRHTALQDVLHRTLRDGGCCTWPTVYPCFLSETCEQDEMKMSKREGKVTTALLTMRRFIAQLLSPELCFNT